MMKLQNLRVHYLQSVISILMMSLLSCNNDNKIQPADPVLVRVGNSKLYMSDLTSKLPGGLTPDDSTKFAHSFIRNWIDRRLLSEVAPGELDMSKIDEMVEQYRNDLILWEYRNQMFNTHSDMSIPEDSLTAYYEKNRQDFRLQYPLVKGVYLKINDSSKELAQLKKLYKSRSTENLDKLEKYALNSALHYDYFCDEWIDWQQIEARIPYDFGRDLNGYLRDHKSLEVSSDGYTYLLSIDSVIPAGGIMPYSSARPLIVDRVIAERRELYDAQLRKKLLEDASEHGKIEIMCDLEL